MNEDDGSGREDRLYLYYTAGRKLVGIIVIFLIIVGVGLFFPSFEPSSTTLSNYSDINTSGLEPNVSGKKDIIVQWVTVNDVSRNTNNISVNTTNKSGKLAYIELVQWSEYNKTDCVTNVTNKSIDYTENKIVGGEFIAVKYGNNSYELFTQDGSSSVTGALLFKGYATLYAPNKTPERIRDIQNKSVKRNNGIWGCDVTDS